MFRNNPLRFASQPDDYLAEKAVIDKFKPEKSLVWASGGCNFLNLKAEFPNESFDSFDFDIVEMDHLKSKLSCLKRNDLEHLNYLRNDQEGLNQSGTYESLLRIMRRYFYEFVVEHDTFNGRFWDVDKDERQEFLEEMFSHPAWDLAFSMFFSKPSLEALVGGVWPEDACSKVKDNIESLLARDDVNSNWFLKHLFLGEYDEEAKPPYFNVENWEKLSSSELIMSHLWDIPIENYNLISLGAYLDFLTVSEQRKSIDYLKANLQKGDVVVLRSLREKAHYLKHLEPDFFVDRSWGDELLKKDRSYLYNQLAIAIRE